MSETYFFLLLSTTHMLELEVHVYEQMFEEV